MEPVTDALLDRMVQAIVDEVDPEQVILFGSRGRGDGRENSDVDLIVVEAEPFGPGRSRHKELVRLYHALNQDMKALVPKTKEITGAYIWAALHLARRKLQTLVRTAGHGTRKLDTPDLMQFPIPSPDPDRLKQVTSLVEHHRLTVEQRQKSKRMLDRVFAVTLHKAFDGSLTASWRNRHMEELVREMKRLERTAMDATP